MDLVLESSDSCINIKFESFQTLKGEGLPKGGLSNQILKKRTEKDYDYYWAEGFSSNGNYPEATVGKAQVAEYDTKGNNIAEKFLENKEKLNEIENIAKGAQQSISFGDYMSMVSVFNHLPIGAFNVGQNVLIITLNVPDLWVSKIDSESVPYTYASDEAIVSELLEKGSIRIGYYMISALETQKVDLSDYYNKTEVNELLTDKLDKVTNNTRKEAYISNMGKQEMAHIDTDKAPWSIAQRDESGALNVGNPKTDYNAVNLAYFNENIPKFTTTLKENGAYTLTIDTGV
jgi:hypothetical protein